MPLIVFHPHPIMRHARRWIFIAIVGFAAYTGCVSASPVKSEQGACQLLRHAAVKYYSLNNPESSYFCVRGGLSKNYYLFSLRASDTALPNGGGFSVSNLLGWYAVRKRDGAVLEWDISEDVPTVIISQALLK